jgi:hypothetical protein
MSLCSLTSLATNGTLSVPRRSTPVVDRDLTWCHALSARGGSVVASACSCLVSSAQIDQRGWNRRCASGAVNAIMSADSRVVTVDR